MKSVRLKSAHANNRKKVLTVQYTDGRSAAIHYAQVGIHRNIARTWIDPETGRRSVGIECEDGSQDFLPYDQPLALTRDPEYLLQTHIERVTAFIQRTLKERKISKHYLAEQLGTSDNQIQRLLNPKILNKNLEQLYRVATLLGLEFEWVIRKAA